jgi:type VI secretion system protein ImpH
LACFSGCFGSVAFRRNFLLFGRVFSCWAFGVGVWWGLFQGRWLRLEPDQYTRIGKKGTYHKLNETAVIGKYVWDHQAKFRVRIGPLDKNTFDAFLPIGNAFMALKKYVDWYKALGQNFDVQLVLLKEDVPRCRLGDKGSTRLGWSTWLRKRPFAHDADDTVLTR